MAELLLPPGLTGVLLALGGGAAGSARAGGGAGYLAACRFTTTAASKLLIKVAQVKGMDLNCLGISGYLFGSSLKDDS